MDNINNKRIRYYSVWLSLVCVLVFIIQNIIPGFTETFYLTQDALTRPWQFLTAIFLHGSVAHLLYNIFALILFGIMLETIIWSKKFLGLFLISGILANIASFHFYSASLGASGAIMAILGCLAVLRPLMTVWAFNLPMPMFIAALLWVGGSVLGIFGFGDQSTGHLAHLSGIVLGVCYGFYLRFRYRNKNQAGFTQKIVLDENSMRKWEEGYLR